VRVNQTLQIRIGWQPDEIIDEPIFAILVNFRVGEGSVATKPEELEPGPVTLH
jgi:hypothetical protein